MIDLQNEYHVTRIVTMGDKDQTGWSETSYVLSYSRNQSLVDKNSVQVMPTRAYMYQCCTESVWIMVSGKISEF